MAEIDDKIRCDACPVLCYIRPGMTGACDRYANRDGELVRVDPHVLLERTLTDGGEVVPFHEPGARMERRHPQRAGADRHGHRRRHHLSRLQTGAVHRLLQGRRRRHGHGRHRGHLFSYCGVKLKIDTDRHLGPECATVRAKGEPVGHVTTGEYGSQMLSLGGVNHLTHGGKKEGRVTCETLLDLCNRKAVELTIDGGASVVVEAGKPPVVNGQIEERMRVGCGSATIGMFAKQWYGKVDEVVVVDDHITGVLSEHQAGKLLGNARHRHQDEGPPLDSRADISMSPSPEPGGAAPISPIRSKSSPASIRKSRGPG